MATNTDNTLVDTGESLTTPLIAEGDSSDEEEATPLGNHPLERTVSSLTAITDDEDDSHGSDAESCFTRHARWFGLASVCLVMTAEYYAIDIPAALHQELKDYMEPADHDANFELRFNLLYTVYAMPNIVLPLVGGVMVDRWGPSRCMVVYSIFLALGQALFALGLSRHSWTLMLAGRAVFGLGGESICVAFSTLFSEWFDPSERAFAFGTQLAVSRLGSVLNNVVSPKVAHAWTTPWALWVGVIWNAVGVLIAFVVKYLHAILHSRRTPSNHNNNNQMTEPLLPNSGEFLEMEHSIESSLSHGHNNNDTRPTRQDAGNQEEQQQISLLDVSRLGSSFWLLCICCMVVYGCINPFNNVASGILLERNYFQTPPSDCQLTLPKQCTSGSLVKDPNPSFNHNGDSCPGHGYAPILPTFPLNISTEDYDHEFLRQKDKVACDDSFWAQECTQDYCLALHQATEQAGRTMSIPYFVSAIISPPIGSLVDRVGRRAMLACGTSFVLMMVHLALAFVPALPVWIPLVGQGVAYALFSAVIWPSVGLVVEQKMTGTAYGIILSAQNLGIALFPIAVAAIYRASHFRYIPNVELLFVVCAGLGSAAGMMLWVLDRKNGNKLGQVAVREH
ncbi:Major facilitator superfamily domain-containing protein 1 [Seminavis robusta]|uniref:Lysosomal dipeptide transporter MFSD1 n=1 Tax=Seminavis robusta TaxID=568900 RepID=A0A9N8DFS6_9STRA|nr:Major facilitator superfamily domain-containing protein 1 [Seminavis robusta]|eukprot:Sro72_g039770.1 Major facilitator superfamily domain-containing protein 1 (621) ;mRNA; r:34331-36307